MLGRDAEAVGEDIDIGGRVARFHAVQGLVRCLPIAKIVDQGQGARPLAPSRTIEKIVTDLARATIDSHGAGVFGADRRMLYPWFGSPVASAMRPIRLFSGANGSTNSLRKATAPESDELR